MADEPQTTAQPGLSAQGVGTGLHTLLQQGWHRLLRAAGHFRRHHDDDPEALHDLRVATRRLRSLYQAFAPAFNPRDPRPGALRELFARTNPQRDQEVALALLETLPERLPWLEQQWQRELANRTEQLLDLPEALHTLAAWPDTPLQPGTHPTLGTFAASRLDKQAKRFRRQLKALNDAWQDDAAHRLRIRAKKLRYLLEPFARQHRPCARAVKQLKELQDLIGDYRDLQLLRATLKSLRQQSNDATRARALKQARRALKARQKAQRRTLKQTLRAQHQQLFDGIDKAIASLR